MCKARAEEIPVSLANKRAGGMEMDECEGEQWGEV